MSAVVESRRAQQLGDCVDVIGVLRLAEDWFDQPGVAKPISEAEAGE
jgi:hypothetical protein